MPSVKRQVVARDKKNRNRNAVQSRETRFQGERAREYLQGGNRVKQNASTREQARAGRQNWGTRDQQRYDIRVAFGAVDGAKR